MALLLAAVTALSGAAGCQGEAGPTLTTPLELGRAYVDQPEVRRQLLEDSLVSRDNGYARVRLANYDETHWGALPVLDPPLRPIDDGDLGHPHTLPSVDERFARLDVAGARQALDQGDLDALRAFGERAFFHYPAQLAPFLPRALVDVAVAASYGLWHGTDGQIGGAVWAELPGGDVQPALSCSSCHAAPLRGTLVAGLNNADFDMGRLLVEAGGNSSAGEWGPGRIDVTADGELNPTAITDLRAVRWQRNLHKDATLHNSLGALAVRLETLIITAHGQSVRPPREVVLALALYVWSLQPEPAADGEPDGESDGASAARRGRTLFAQECARCHQGEGRSGPPVALDVVGTDPTVGLSPERTTGSYRVPSLRGVRDRRRLFSAGQVADLTELLDPERSEQGHPYGLGLGDGGRADLQAFLETL
jgi:hypothetical protein